MGGDHCMSILVGFYQDLAGNDELQKTSNMKSGRSHDGSFSCAASLMHLVLNDGFNCILKSNLDTHVPDGE